MPLVQMQSAPPQQGRPEERGLVLPEDTMETYMDDIVPAHTRWRLHSEYSDVPK